MLQEKSDERLALHAEHLFLVSVCVVFVTEGHVPSVHRDNTAVRDGGSERIPRKVAYGIPLAVEGFFNERKPTLPEKAVHKRFPFIPGLQVFCKRKVQPAFLIIFLKGTEKLAPEHRCDSSFRQEEALVPRLNKFPVRGDPTAGNAYVEMGMEVQFLPPGVEHADDPGFSAHKPPVSAERDEGVPDTAEQEVQNKLQV